MPDDVGNGLDISCWSWQWWAFAAAFWAVVIAGTCLLSCLVERCDWRRK